MAAQHCSPSMHEYLLHASRHPHAEEKTTLGHVLLHCTMAPGKQRPYAVYLCMAGLSTRCTEQPVQKFGK